MATQAAQHGDGPDAPTQMSTHGWWEAAKQTGQESRSDNLSLVASGIAFNAFLALVPFLTAVVLGYGLVASPSQVAQHIAVLANMLPQQAASIVGSELKNMVQTAGAGTGLGMVVTLGIALYGAMRGATGVISGLNIAYGIDETRSFLRQTAVALAITFGLIFVFVLASVGIGLVNFISSIMPHLGGAGRTALQIGFWIASASAVSVVIAVIYAYAPNRAEPSWIWLTPGSIIATSVWIVATFAFSFYVKNFGSYEAMYGALGAVIIFLTWLYLSAYILLLGAELNQVLARRAGKDEQIDRGKSQTRPKRQKSGSQ